MTDEVLKKILDIDGKVEIPFIVMKSLRKVRGFKVGDVITFDGNIPLNMKFKFNSLPPGGQKVYLNKEEVLNNEWVFIGSGSDACGVTYYKFKCCQRIDNKPMTFKVYGLGLTSRMKITITALPKSIGFLGFSEYLDFRMTFLDYLKISVTETLFSLHLFKEECSSRQSITVTFHQNNTKEFVRLIMKKVKSGKTVNN